MKRNNILMIALFDMLGCGVVAGLCIAISYIVEYFN